MITLAQAVRQRARGLVLRVRVAGVLLTPSNPKDALGVPTVHQVSISKSIDNPAPACTITVSRASLWMKDGYPVTVDAGYAGLTQRIFTGTKQRHVKGVERGDLVCAGETYKLVRATQMATRDLNGLGVRTAIGDLLDDVGIVSYKIDEVPNSFVLGTASDAQLSATSALQMLKFLMEVEGCLLYETGDGVVYVRPLLPLPATTAFKTFRTDDATTAWIIEAPFDEDPTQLRTKVTLTGAVVNGVALVQTATLSNSDLVQPTPPAGFFIGSEHFNPLLDTSAKLTEVLNRLITLEGRVPGRLQLRCPGDPELEPGMTVYVKEPECDTDGNFFVYSVTHNIDAQQGWETVLDLRGGDRAGGTLGINPVASFSYLVEREVVGTQVYAFVTLDASRSFDPDGSIASIAWSDNQAAAATSPNIDTLTGVIVTVRVDPTAVSGDFIVTCTVTDNSGLVTTASQTIPIAADAQGVTIPAIFAALNNRFSATPDGGQNWNDQSGNATNVTKVAAMPPAGVFVGIAVFGRDDGAIYRTTDFCVSALTLVRAADGVAIRDIAWDWRDITKVWALADDLKLYVSTDLGATWALIADFRSSLSLGSNSTGRRIGLPGAGGEWVFGGTGITNNGRPLIAWLDGDGVHGIASVYGGELQTDLGAGNTNLRIVDAVDMGDGGGLVIIMENADGGASGVRPIYHCDSPFSPLTWKRATGLSAGLTTGRYVVPTSTPAKFVAAFNDRDTWVSNDGIAWTQRANVMPTGVTPNRALWMRDEREGLATAMTYIIAAEDSGGTIGIYKSHDEIATVGALRPATGFPAWPASAKGKDVAIASRGPAAIDDRLLVVQSPPGIGPQTYELDTCALIGGVWAKKEDGSSTSQDVIDNVKKLGANHYRIKATMRTNGDNTYSGTCGQLQRSTDGGATWSNVGPAPVLSGSNHWGVSDIDIAPDGTLWLCATSIESNADTGLEPKIYKSTDDGATWGSPVYTESTKTNTHWELMHRIACHPLDFHIIVVFGDTDTGSTRTWNTQNAGSSFTRNTASAGGTSTTDQWAIVLWDSNRLGACRGTNWTYSDDFGATAFTNPSINVVTGGDLRALIRGTPYGLAFAGGGSTITCRVARTRDYGISWEQIINETDIGNNKADIALAYDAAKDILYIATNDNESGRRIYALDHAATLTANAGAQTVRNLALNLDALFNQQIAPRGMALR